MDILIIKDHKEELVISLTEEQEAILDYKVKGIKEWLKGLINAQLFAGKHRILREFGFDFHTPEEIKQQVLSGIDIKSFIQKKRQAEIKVEQDEMKKRQEELNKAKSIEQEKIKQILQQPEILNMLKEKIQMNIDKSEGAEA